MLVWRNNVVGHNQRFRVICQSFRRSIETVSRHFHQVLYVVGEIIRDEMIRVQTIMCSPKFLGAKGGTLIDVVSFL